MKTSPSPLTATDILHLATSGNPIPMDRALATFANPDNWVQIYNGKTTCSHYQARPCEWGFIGPVRPPYELAQNAINDMFGKEKPR